MKSLTNPLIFIIISILLMHFPLITIAQKSSIQLIDYDLKGKVKEVTEQIVEYTWDKTSKNKTKSVKSFNPQGMLVFDKVISPTYLDNNYEYHTTYSYSQNNTSLKFNYKVVNNGIIESEYIDDFQLIKTGIGYLKDLKSNPSIKRNSKGEITEYIWYSYTNPPKVSSSYNISYVNGNIFEVQAGSVLYQYDPQGNKTYQLVIGSPSYFSYDKDGFLFKEILYPLTKVTYYYYEYIKDNRGNWIQKRKYTNYPDITGKWEIKEIIYRKITYQDGVTTGSDSFSQKDLDQALTTQKNLPIWTEDPRSTDNISNKQGCVKGDCTNGFGKMNYENGSYEGFFKNGKRHGYGYYQWEDKSIYSGFWLNDIIEGHGFYNIKNDPILKGYTGYFKNGTYHGKGSLMKTENSQRGIFKDGILSSSMNFYSNNVTTGCTAGDCNNGFGRYVFNNGDQFDGFFTNGIQSSGTYNFKGGGNYIGEFNTSGQFHGQGSYLDKENNLQSGEWLNGQFTGQGVYYESKSKKYNPGVWKNGSIVQQFRY